MNTILSFDAIILFQRTLDLLHTTEFSHHFSKQMCFLSIFCIWVFDEIFEFFHVHVVNWIELNEFHLNFQYCLKIHAKLQSWLANHCNMNQDCSLNPSNSEIYGIKAFKKIVVLPRCSVFTAFLVRKPLKKYPFKYKKNTVS